MDWIQQNLGTLLLFALVLLCPLTMMWMMRGKSRNSHTTGDRITKSDRPPEGRSGESRDGSKERP